MFKEKRHTAYLIRWQEDGAQEHWRSTVENVYTGEKLNFIDRHELMQFLWRSLSDDVPPAENKTSQQGDEQ